MIDIPDFSRAFEWENGFYLSCGSARIGKMLAHYELYKMAAHVAGAIVECGVFKGASFARFAAFRELFGGSHSKRLIGFDTFGTFPETGFDPDKPCREKFIREAGSESISVEQMWDVLAKKHCNSNVDLVVGDICDTVPKYLAEHPGLKISLLNLDTDIYEPAVTILKHLYPRIASGGVLILDDYGVFPGETMAVDAYFGCYADIRKFDFCATPCYLVKK